MKPPFDLQTFVPPPAPRRQTLQVPASEGSTSEPAPQNEAELADAKIILSNLEKVVVEVESRHEVVVSSSTQNCPTTIPADIYPLQLIVLPEEEIQRHLPENLHAEATGLEGRDLLYPIPWDISIRSDKKASRSMHRSLPWRKLLICQTCLEARRQYRLLHWAEVELLINSWCYITLY